MYINALHMERHKSPKTYTIKLQKMLFIGDRTEI